MLQTIIISISTSLIVSLITFILGLKSGKNQADRALLQNLYKKVYSHFNELESCIDEGRPKEWSDYKKVESMYSTKYYPMIRELERTGDILFLNKSIAKEALSLESECLKYSYEANRIIGEIHKCIIDNPQFINGGIVFDQNENKSRAKTQNKTNCTSFRIVSYFLFLDKDKLKETLAQWGNSGSQYALSFTTRGNPPNNSFTLYPDDLNIAPDDFVDRIITLMKEKGYFEICEAEVNLKHSIIALNKKVAIRAKNPTNFWETFFGAFADIFH